MSSFQLVENKIYESDFFLEKIKECNDSGNQLDCNYYLSAFVSSSRSITFALQKSMKGSVGFIEWYNSVRTILSESKIARFFVDARNKSEKEGITLVDGGSISKCLGDYSIGLYFRDIYNDSSMNPIEFRQLVADRISQLLTNGYVVDDPNRPGYLPPSYFSEKNVYEICREYLTLLLQIVLDCFTKYGEIIDPAKYYTVAAMRKSSRCIEDYEEELGLPRGWTAALGDDKKRMLALKYSEPESEVFETLAKYLGITPVQGYLETIEE